MKSWTGSGSSKVKPLRCFLAKTQFRKAALSAWWLTVGVVTVLALMPAEHLQFPALDWWDKGQHAIAFLILTAWALWLRPQTQFRVVLGMLVYGAGLELAQWLVGWRYAEWADLLADTVGIGMAWGCTGWLRSARITGVAVDRASKASVR